MRTNQIGKEQIFPMMRGCLIKQQADEDPDEGVKVEMAIIAAQHLHKIALEILSKRFINVHT